MKSTIKTGLAAIMLFAISCTKENMAPAPSGSDELSAAKTASFNIGDNYGGGIIFYIDNTGIHGLIADDADLGVMTWYNGPFNWVFTGADATKIYKGKSNTGKIVNAQGSPVDGNYAAWACSKSKKNGYKDWYLPSRDELEQLYIQRSVVGGFTTGVNDQLYWSSSALPGSNELYAWSFYFNTMGNGFATLNFYRSNAFHVRAVRKF